MAQMPGCDGVRYLDHVFVDVDVTTEVTYGSNFSQAGFINSLEMDIYEPAGDALDARPLVVLAHGGSFIAGSRQDLAALCTDLAMRGYVAVTIDYRLYDVFAIPTKQVVSEVVIQAVSDMRAAIRFMRQEADNGNTYGIDPDFVFAGGVSAGGITAVHTGFIDAGDDLGEPMTTVVADNGGLEGDSNEIMGYNSAVQGILNYSGAIKNVEWIGLNNPPIFSAHDDGDGTVPYGSETTTALITPIFIEGSGSIHEKAEDIGLWNDLITIENSAGHVSYFQDGTDPIFYEVLEASAFMMEYVYCNQITSVPTVQVPDFVVYPNPTNDLIGVVSSEGQTIDFVQIYDLEGRLILAQRFAASRVEMNLERLQAGTYVARIHTGDTWVSEPLMIN
jgi:para-nitrobenzyl esterase